MSVGKFALVNITELAYETPNLVFTATVSKDAHEELVEGLIVNIDTIPGSNEHPCDIWTNEHIYRLIGDVAYAKFTEQTSNAYAGEVNFFFIGLLVLGPYKPVTTITQAATRPMVE